jgi:hypothetical protein
MLKAEENWEVSTQHGAFLRGTIKASRIDFSCDNVRKAGITGAAVLNSSFTVESPMVR